MQVLIVDYFGPMNFKETSNLLISSLMYLHEVEWLTITL